jgi:outer membrane lipoprotein carrier protein
MKRIFAACVAAVCAFAAEASGLDALETFVKSAHSGRAEFTQVVTAPARDGQAARSKTSSGTFEFLRPNRFRFDYRKPFEQTIVADGQTLWLYDADLNQVTARKQAQALGSTPAALVAASPDVNALRKDFNLEAAGDKDGMQWVQATPKTKDGQLTSVKIGFRGNELAQLDILDSFGQRSAITFTKMELNANVPAERFQFKPPKGADVVKQ